MPENQKVLIEIATAANLAGVKAAQESFLGLGASTLALAGILYGVIEVGKAALENYKQQSTAQSDLAQAVGVYNAQVGKAIPATEKEAEAIAKAKDELAANKRALQEFDAEHRGHVATVTGGMTELDKMHRQDIQNQITKARTTDARSAAERRLAEFDVAHQQRVVAASGLSEAQQMRREDIVARVTKSQKALTLAEQEGTHQVIKKAINLDDLNKKTDDFISTNSRYIENQYDAKEAVSTFVRAGNDEKDSLRLLGDSVDLAAIKHESLTDAAHTLILAEAGNSKGLRDLGITTDQVNAIMNSHLTTEQKHAALMDLIEKKTAKGRDTVDDLQQKQNKLNKDWQDFTATIGPGVKNVLGDIATAADWAAIQAKRLADELNRVANDNEGWARLQEWILSTIDPSGALRAANAASNPQPSGGVGGVFPTVRDKDERPRTTNNITINVNGTNDGQAIAKIIARNLAKLGVT